MGHLNVNQTMELADPNRNEARWLYGRPEARFNDCRSKGHTTGRDQARGQPEQWANLQRTAGLRSTTSFRFHFSMLPRTQH